MKTKLTAIYLAVIMVASSLGSVACDRDQISQTREAAERLIIYSEAGIHIVEEIRESGTLTGGLEESMKIALQSLTTVRDTTQKFVDRAKGYTKFDAGSRADLAQAFADVMSALKELQPQAAIVTKSVIDVLNAQGITRIKDPDAILRRLSLALSVLDTSARLIQTRLNP